MFRKPNWIALTCIQITTNNVAVDRFTGIQFAGINVYLGDKRLLRPSAYVQYQLIRAIQRLLYYFRLVILGDARFFLTRSLSFGRAFAWPVPGVLCAFSLQISTFDWAHSFFHTVVTRHIHILTRWRCQPTRFHTCTFSACSVYAFAYVTLEWIAEMRGDVVDTSLVFLPNHFAKWLSVFLRQIRCVRDLSHFSVFSLIFALLKRCALLER